MGRKGVFTKSLIVIGTLLVWFPILVPIAFSLGAIISGHMFRFDYLITAELFPVELIGGGLLTWAAQRAQLHQKLIGWSLCLTIVSLVGGQALAVTTGLASGKMEPTGWIWLIVIASIAVYSLSLIVIGIGGILLLRDIFRPH